MRTRVYRECALAAIPSIASVASNGGNLTGAYCAQANRDIAENLLEFNADYAHPPAKL
jgi:hypothetical protein